MATYSGTFLSILIFILNPPGREEYTDSDRLENGTNLLHATNRDSKKDIGSNLTNYSVFFDLFIILPFK